MSTENIFTPENCRKYGLFPQRLQSKLVKQSYFFPLEGKNAFDYDYRTPKLEVRWDYNYDTAEECMRPFLTVPQSAIYLRHIDDLDDFVALYWLLSGRNAPFQINYCEYCNATGWVVRSDVWEQCSDCGGYGYTGADRHD